MTFALTPEAKKLLRHLIASRLINPGSRLLLGLSGGGDSTALLYLLKELEDSLNLKLFAAHLNHGLRESAPADASFVEELCQRLDVPLKIANKDVRAYALDKGLSLEEAGRQLRYRFLRYVQERYHAHYLLTAHTATEQAETLLMRIISGTGPRGLCGIRARGPQGLVRPLLPFTRQELRQYLEKHQLTWCEDETNLVPEAPRTRVRLILMPLLSSWNPKITESLGRLAQACTDDDDFFIQQVNQAAALLECSGDETPPNQGRRLEVSALLALPKAVRVRLLAMLFTALSKNTPTADNQLEAVHFQAIEDLLQGPAGRSTNLPGGFTAARTRRELLLYRDEACSEATPLPDFTLPAREGLFEASPWKLRLTCTASPDCARPQPHLIYLNPQQLQLPLRVRSRQDGDYFYPAGGCGRVKLKKYLNELGLSAQERQNLPLLVHGSDIVWVIGHRADQRYLAAPGQKQVLAIKADFY